MTARPPKLTWLHYVGYPQRRRWMFDWRAWWHLAETIRAMPEGPAKEAAFREFSTIWDILHMQEEAPSDAALLRFNDILSMPEGAARKAALVRLRKRYGFNGYKWRHLIGLAPPKRRQPGGGRKRCFVEQDRIDALRDVCRDALRENRKLITKTHDDLVEHLRPQLKLSRAERGASTRSLLRHIIKPALDELRTK